MDPDLYKRTPADWPDVRHETTDQKVGGSSPSERATVSAGRRPGHDSSGSFSSSSGLVLASLVPVASLAGIVKGAPSARQRWVSARHRDREPKTRSAKSECVRRGGDDHQGQASAGNERGRSAPVASAKTSPCWAGARWGDASRRRAAVPASRRPVVARRCASRRQRACRSVRVIRPMAPTIISPCKGAVWGAPVGRVRDSRTNRARPRPRPYTATHWHLIGWTGQSRGRKGPHEFILS